MITALVLIISPFVINGLTAVVVYLTNIKSDGLKRVVVAVFSLVAIVSASVSTGTPIDAANVNANLTILAETFLAFLMSHGSYTMFLKRKTG